MAKSLFRALVALSFLAPLWLNAAPRVITLSPANTELAFAAGITPVGVSSYSDYPPQAQKIEQVSTWQGMNLERIVALKPDLVIAWRGGNAERQVDQLASLGIKVMWVDATSIEQIANALRQLAPWSPQPDKAEQAAQSLLDQYAQDGAEYAAYHALYRALVTAKRALDALTSSEEEKQRRIAELSEEIDTIDAAALTAGEEERLMERRKVIMHAQGILDGLTAAHQALSGDDSGEMMGAAVRPRHAFGLRLNLSRPMCGSRWKNAAMVPRMTCCCTARSARTEKAAAVLTVCPLPPAWCGIFPPGC